MSDTRPSPTGFNLGELAVAAVFFLIGLYMAFEGARFGTGTITRIGPGFFPVAIGVLLMGLSVAVAFEVRKSGAANPRIPLRITVVIIAALLAFAVLVGTAGLVPAAFAVVFISRFAEPGSNVVGSVILAAVLSIAAWLAFIEGFNLPLKPFWW